MKKTTAIVLAILSVGKPVLAQELDSLANTIETGVEKSYPFVRCAALYYSISLYAGETRLGNELYSSYVDSVEKFMRSAALVRAQDGVDAEVSSRQVLQETNTITDIYLARYRNNYAVGGQAFGADPLFQSDITFCNVISERLKQ